MATYVKELGFRAYHTKYVIKENSKKKLEIHFSLFSDNLLLINFK